MSLSLWIVLCLDINSSIYRHPVRVKVWNKMPPWQQHSVHCRHHSTPQWQMHVLTRKSPIFPCVTSWSGYGDVAIDRYCVSEHLLIYHVTSLWLSVWVGVCTKAISWSLKSGPKIALSLSLTEATEVQDMISIRSDESCHFLQSYWPGFYPIW